MRNQVLRNVIIFVLNLLGVQTAYAYTGIGANASGIQGYLSANAAYVVCAVLLCVIALLVLELWRTKKRVSVYDAVHGAIDVRAEKQLLKEIEKGFENEEFKMYLQFIVENKTKKIVSAEALSRWENANGEVVAPFKYIGVMEKHGLISKLDYYMFEMACRKLSAWKDEEFARFAISCNFTRITISEKDFVDKIQGIADKYDFDRSKLMIEITEDAIEKNLVTAMNNIIKCKELGFQITLDDIGCGYTSLINLCEYPLDVVKIDRDILLKTDQLRGKKLFLGIISLAHNLNLKVVCEGVETEEQNTLVTESDCDFIQGWYYTKALPETKAEAFAKAYMIQA